MGQRTTFLRSLRPAGGLAALVAGAAGLTLDRLLFEALFPAGRWPGGPATGATLALLSAAGGWLWWRHRAAISGPWPACQPFLGLGLSLLYLPQAGLRPLAGRFWWLAGLWLFGLLSLGQRRPAPRGLVWLAWLGLGLLPVYLLTMGRTVGRADTFEFQVVVPRLGIVHPTGYPLYLLLGKAFTWLPAGSVAWRVNLSSLTYALGALGALAWLVRQLTGRWSAGILAGAILALTPTFWSQAIEAEVYSLHLLLVTLALGLMVTARRQAAAGRPPGRSLWFLALTIGLGLTNHLTTVILIPALALTLFWLGRARRLPGQNQPGSERRSERTGRGRSTTAVEHFRLLLVLLAPLLLYLYLPWRWRVVNGEPMGWGRFLDWVLGGRFQGALQLDAWWRDPARYEVVGRLFLAEWDWLGLGVGLLGLAWLVRRRPGDALLLTVTGVGFAFYCLNYFVPDLAVFLLPAQVVVAAGWGQVLAAGLGAIGRPGVRAAGGYVGVLLLAGWQLSQGPTTWVAVDRSGADALSVWGQGVLAQELAPGATILADSERIAPLYYLQQAEGVRPDLDIQVLPDEAAYRQALVAGLARGRPVYLARFLPGLAGAYHLRSAGPLTEVATRPVTALPAGVTPADLALGPVRLVGYELETVAAVDPGATALTLFWQADQPISETLLVYNRWAWPDRDGQADERLPGPSAGQHPANDSYPLAAWRPGEIVADYHLLPRPWLGEPTMLAWQVALGPPFSSPAELRWQTVTIVAVAPPPLPDSSRALRIELGPTRLLVTAFPGQVRPATPVTVLLAGCGPPGSTAPRLALEPVAGNRPAAPAATEAAPFPACGAGEAPLRWSQGLDTDLPPGHYRLLAWPAGGAARCGWLARPSAACSLGNLSLSGVPLPAGATSFDDKIALLSLNLPEQHLEPGGQLAVEVVWQSLTPLSENYTVFAQVLSEADRLVGQVDVWPRQGTYPTSQWPAGARVADRYIIPLDDDLPPGDYRLILGWYLLGTPLRRLPVLDAAGRPVDDRVLVPGLTVP